jgi:hypothetical protein
MLKVDLRQNALHTLHHAIEHLQWSQGSTPGRGERSFDDDDHSVQWRNKDAHLCFVAPEFTRLPSVYNLKFALLHLIQASELLLKSYVEQCAPEALFVRPGSTKTINLQTALNFTIERNPTLLAPAEVALLLEAKAFRNTIEHYKIELTEKRLRSLCIDFLAICVLIAQALLSISIADAFSWDYLRDKPDEVANYLATVLAQSSDAGLSSARKAGESWASENASQPVFLCLSCGARAVSRDRGVCMGCGAEGDEETVTMLEDFELAERRIADLRKRLDSM